MNTNIPLIVLLVLLAMLGCGPSHCPVQTENRNDPSAVKMRHQILFSSKTRQDVFEGFMVLLEGGFYVKAFAGPGVELFTVARDGERRADVLHIDGLKDRINIKRVGSDINRIYFKGCSANRSPSKFVVLTNSTQKCVVNGENVEEHYDGDGYLASRSFPDAHGIGLNILYDGYEKVGGRWLPKRVVLKWGSGQKMVIVMLSSEIAVGNEAEVLAHLLKESK